MTTNDRNAMIANRLRNCLSGRRSCRWFLQYGCGPVVGNSSRRRSSSLAAWVSTRLKPMSVEKNNRVKKKIRANSLFHVQCKFCNLTFASPGNILAWNDLSPDDFLRVRLTPCEFRFCYRRIGLRRFMPCCNWFVHSSDQRCPDCSLSISFKRINLLPIHLKVFRISWPQNMFQPSGDISQELPWLHSIRSIDLVLQAQQVDLSSPRSWSARCSLQRQHDDGL